MYALEWTARVRLHDRKISLFIEMLYLCPACDREYLQETSSGIEVSREFVAFTRNISVLHSWAAKGNMCPICGTKGDLPPKHAEVFLADLRRWLDSVWFREIGEQLHLRESTGSGYSPGPDEIPYEYKAWADTERTPAEGKSWGPFVISNRDDPISPIVSELTESSSAV